MPAKPLSTAWPLVYVALHHITGDATPDGQQRAVEMFARTLGIRGVRCPVVLKRVGGSYRVVSGRRRVAASRLLGLRLVPALVAPEPVNPKVLAAIDSVQGEDTKLADRIAAARDLLATGWPVESVAQAMGRSSSHTKQLLAFDRLPEQAFALLDSGAISHSAGADLVSLYLRGATAERVNAVAQKIAGQDGSGGGRLAGEAAQALVHAEMEALGRPVRSRPGRPRKAMSSEVRPSLRDVLAGSSDPAAGVLAEGLLRIDRALTFVEMERIPGTVRQIVDHTLREVRKCRS